MTAIHAAHHSTPAKLRLNRATTAVSQIIASGKSDTRPWELVTGTVVSGDGDIPPDVDVGGQGVNGQAEVIPGCGFLVGAFQGTTNGTISNLPLNGMTVLVAMRAPIAIILGAIT